MQEDSAVTKEVHLPPLRGRGPHRAVVPVGGGGWGGPRVNPQRCSFRWRSAMLRKRCGARGPASERWTPQRRHFVPAGNLSPYEADVGVLPAVSAFGCLGPPREERYLGHNTVLCNVCSAPLASLQKSLLILFRTFSLVRDQLLFPCSPRWYLHDPNWCMPPPAAVGKPLKF